ncbi:sigma-70 family RNA polymerase sigma factor [Klebsiella oxytoca]|uniref:sigma-70 family RNA polymerase sigma factor n=1 Tax=Klebsiella oxytoca TaxID=571 RepID=UPI001C822A6F|nr:sigma-70 family RNA polymerase sigma factor [Klebsiella oxytoca]ELP2759474.1 sigma-70 family RNA polymerase sigma factor [Klebsiella oxytoca]MBX4769489.1 sigma-70 family RNA polymerase sigma factor [Klebsiella oxytoca]
MKSTNISPEELRSVSGKMVACRAAEKLGITVARFYYLAQRHQVSTAYVRPLWSKGETQRLIAMRKSSMTVKRIAAELNRTEWAIKKKLGYLRKDGLI